MRFCSPRCTPKRRSVVMPHRAQALYEKKWTSSLFDNHRHDVQAERAGKERVFGKNELDLVARNQDHVEGRDCNGTPTGRPKVAQDFRGPDKTGTGTLNLEFLSPFCQAL